MAIVYIAVMQDRHIDLEIEVFDYREAAIKWARKYMKEHVAHPEGLEENDNGNRWKITYKYESDYAYVIQADYHN